MERLNLSETPQNALYESVIHCARYANIIHLVKDKIVLDIACGEGYGAALLMKAGAKRVVAIDISDEAISKAKRLFSDYGVEYLVGDANTVAEYCGVNVFDVVVSIETIEHIHTPDIFLKSIKYSAKEQAIFYITCPNDNWYYPQENQFNPYHVKKYNFEEFKALTTEALGSNVVWGYGAAVFGFGTTMTEPKSFEHIGQSWLEIQNADTSIVVRNSEKEQVDDSNCSFFIGLWNAPVTKLSNSVFPINMDAYSRITAELEFNIRAILSEEIAQHKSVIETLESTNLTTSSELKKTKLLISAVRAENNALRLALSSGSINEIDFNFSVSTEECELLKMENNDLRIKLAEFDNQAYWVYLRLVRMTPKWLKRVIRKMIKMFGK